MRHPAWILALLVGCGGRTPVQSPEPAEAEPVEVAPVASALSPTENADQVVARALKEVALRRELPPKGPVEGKTVSREELVRLVKVQIEKEIPPDVITAQSELLFAIGSAGADFDYQASILDLMGSQLAGFYAPKEKTMYLAEDLDGREREATLAHELVHALQDQHYDLGPRMEFKMDRTDEQSAVHCLAEGDATSAMMDALVAPRGMTALDLPEGLIAMESRGAIEMAPDAADVPPLLKRSVISPYVDGLFFVHWARRRGGWKNVDAIWRKPPTTTEQLLHPEKYLSGEVGETIALPVAPKAGPTKEMYRDVLGEQSLRLTFEEWVPRRTAVDAAAGWAGDRLVVLREGGQLAVAWHVRFDTAADAQQGFLAFARGVLQVGSKDKKPVSQEAANKATPGKTVCRERPDAGPIAALLNGKDVAFVAGPYRRSGKTAQSAGKCATSLPWAKQVVAQR